VLFKDNRTRGRRRRTLRGDTGAVALRARGAWQAECDSAEQVHAAVAAGRESVLFDNMSPGPAAQCVGIARGHCVTEASGRVSLSRCV